MSRYIPGPRNKMDSKPRIPSEPMTEPLLIRLLEDVGLLPAGYLYSIPAFEAARLIHRRKAVAVGTVGTMADVCLTQDDLEEAGIA